MSIIHKLTPFVCKNPVVRNKFQLRFNSPVFNISKDIVDIKNKVTFTHILPKEIEKTNGKTELITANLLPNTAVVYKKIKPLNDNTIIKFPCEINIAETEDSYMTTFHFLDKNTKMEIGYVKIVDWRKTPKIIKQHYLNSFRLLDDAPELGITGDRVSIDYLQNNFQDKFSGIGELGDKLAIEYCLKNGIKPNITSVADYNSHAAHYKRGRRFFEISKYDPDIDAYEFKATYGTLDPNKIIEERIKSTPKGEKVDTRDLGGLYMYMPQDVIQKYLSEIKKHPLLS